MNWTVLWDVRRKWDAIYHCLRLLCISPKNAYVPPSIYCIQVQWGCVARSLFKRKVLPTCNDGLHVREKLLKVSLYRLSCCLRDPVNNDVMVSCQRSPIPSIDISPCSLRQSLSLSLWPRLSPVKNQQRTVPTTTMQQYIGTTTAFSKNNQTNNQIRSTKQRMVQLQPNTK